MCSYGTVNAPRTACDCKAGHAKSNADPANGACNFCAAGYSYNAALAPTGVICEACRVGT